MQPVTDPTPVPPQPSAAVAPSAAPPGVAHPKTVRSFVRRAGRTTTGQAKALQALGPRFVLPYAPTPLDADAAFGRRAPLIVGLFIYGGAAFACAFAPVLPFLPSHDPASNSVIRDAGTESQSVG